MVEMHSRIHKFTLHSEVIYDAKFSHRVVIRHRVPDLIDNSGHTLDNVVSDHGSAYPMNLKDFTTHQIYRVNSAASLIKRGQIMSENSPPEMNP